MRRKMTSEVNTSAWVYVNTVRDVWKRDVVHGDQVPGRLWGAEHRLYMRFSVHDQVFLASCRRDCQLHKLRQVSNWFQRARTLRAGSHQQTHATLCPDSGPVPWRPILPVCSILLMRFSQSSLCVHFCKITFAPVTVHIKLELKYGLQNPKQWDCTADRTPFVRVYRVSCASQDSKMTILPVKQVSSRGRVLLNIFVPCYLSWCRKNEGRRNERSENRGWRGEKSVDFLLFFQLLVVLTWTSLFHKVQSPQF